MTEESTAIGVVIGAGAVGAFLRGGPLGLTASSAEAATEFKGICDASSPADGVSICWVVLLKHRARDGRRNVGGRADEDIFESRMDRRIVLLSIVKLKTELVLI